MALAVAALALAACPICTEDGDLRVTEGSLPLKPGESVQLVFFWEGAQRSSPNKVGPLWYVDEILGGEDVRGRITQSGRYTAPAVPPADNPYVSASVEGLPCHDCCTVASLVMTLVR